MVRLTTITLVEGLVAVDADPVRVVLLTKQEGVLLA